MSFEYKATGKSYDLKLFKRILGLVKEHKSIIYLSIVLTILLSVVSPFITLLLQRTIDNEIANGDFNGLLIKVSFILVFLVIQVFVQYFHSYNTNWLGQVAIKKLRTQVFNHIISFRLKVYDRTPIGVMITRTVSDVESVADVFGQGFINLVADFLKIAVILSIMFATNWQLTLITLSVFPLLFLLAYWFKNAVKSAFLEVRNQVSRLNAFLQEHISGMFIVQIFNRQDQEYAKFKEINKKHLKANIKSIFAYSIFFPVIELLTAIAISLIVWYGAGKVLNNELTIGVLILFILYINQLFTPIRTITDKFNTLQMGMVSADRIFQVLDMHEQIPSNGKYLSPALKGEVEFKDVWFAYEGENWILKGVSFKVKQGETLAIVGHTGAGKSTITSLINRLYEHQKGEILLDGIPIQDYDLPILRQKVAVVLQDIFLFSDSLANNIRLFNNDISEEDMLDAAKMVGVDEYILSLPLGLNYNVQERGSSLSTGQRQLISFIRAILQKPAILILDEATASVDQETEELLQNATQKLLKNSTSIVIAHRLATIQNADKILVLDKGKVIEEGNHTSLMEKNGIYRKLYELQYANVVV